MTWVIRYKMERRLIGMDFERVNILLLRADGDFLRNVLVGSGWELFEGGGRWVREF